MSNGVKVIKINKAQREEWNRFVTENHRGSFLQSFEWSQFQESLGRRVFRLAIPGIAQVLVIKYDLPFGKSYLYSPRGPITSNYKLHPEKKSKISNGARITNYKLLLEKVREIAKQENSVFFRMDCPSFREGELEKLGFISPPKNYYFSATSTSPWVALLDINRSEEEILKSMKPKTRYNIRLAQRKGVVVKGGSSTKELNIFYKLLTDTAKREKFASHTKKHYQNLIRAFGPDVKISIALYKKIPISAILVLFWGNEAFYLHGSSSSRYRQLMATYLVQWQAIQEAKKQGCKFYNLGGVVPPGSINHPWQGITRFKIGFGSQIVEYARAYDLIYQPPWYKIYNLIRGIKHL